MASAMPELGETVAGKYFLEEELGRGGMGVVFRARHVITDRVVALKWLLEDDPQRRARFMREARAMGRLSHPNVVGVLDVGDHDGATFLVMDYLEGKSLRDLIDERRCEPAEAIQLLMPALSGVAAAHQAGLLHRDLKPENLFVLCDEDGTPFDTKVLDFGVAKPFGEGHGVASLTHSGAIVGTPRYMAPEQLGEEGELDPRCDLYSLGLILYELLTGELPYRSRSLNALLLEILTAEIRSPQDIVPELPDELCAVVLKALSRARADRFADVASFAKALEPWANGVRFEAPRKVHAVKPGESSGVARVEKEGSGSGRVTGRKSLVSTQSERPEKSDAAVSGTDPTVEAPSKEILLAGANDTAAPSKPSRTPIYAVVGALAFIGIAGIAVVASMSSDPEAPAVPEPSAAEVRTEEPASDPEPGQPSAAELIEAHPTVAPEAPAIELPAGEDPPEPAPEVQASRPQRPRARPSTTQEATPPPSEPAPEDPTIRVRTRAGTLGSDDF
jgi:serine/threonine protein kinase